MHPIFGFFCKKRHSDSFKLLKTLTRKAQLLTKFFKFFAEKFAVRNIVAAGLLAEIIMGNMSLGSVVPGDRREYEYKVQEKSPPKNYNASFRIYKTRSMNGHCFVPEADSIQDRKMSIASLNNSLIRRLLRYMNNFEVPGLSEILRTFCAVLECSYCFRKMYCSLKMVITEVRFINNLSIN
uniref:DDE_Tnp_1_7 domain-containing protein n=1 Tax=Heterorhabditis bacteriophora TaxID=37862 RepID=A0A1I7W7A9_HETBA